MMIAKSERATVEAAVRRVVSNPGSQSPAQRVIGILRAQGWNDQKIRTAACEIIALLAWDKKKERP